MSLLSRFRGLRVSEIVSALHVPLLVGLAAACTAAAVAVVSAQLEARRALHRRLRVVITGGSKGLGFALACAHVRAGDSVVICGRDESAVHHAVSRLRMLVPGASTRAFGTRCDVAKADDVAALFAFAREHMSGVDVLINNAGISSPEYKALADTPVLDIGAIVATNLTGTLLCAREAIRAMAGQLGGGHIFNVDGAGSRGTGTPRYAVYGATKAALPQLMGSLASETADTGIGIHTLSPGMVITDLLMGRGRGRGTGSTSSGSRTRHDKGTLRVFNILAEKPETAAAWLVPRARAIACVGIAKTEAVRRKKQLQQLKAGSAQQPLQQAADGQATAASAASGGATAAAAVAEEPLPPVQTVTRTYTRYLTPASAIWRFIALGLTRRAKNRLVDETTGDVL